MAEYIELPLVDDADALTELGVDYMQASTPGLICRPGNPETILLEANGQIGAEVVAQASLVAPIIFAYLGQNLVGLAPHLPVSARTSVSITFAADAVLTVDAGALLSVPNPDGNLYAFSTDVDAISPAGGGVVDVPITALEPGAAANGSYGSSELIEVLDGVDAVAVTTPASGGADEESDDDYLNRLADAMTILAPRPILPQDHATMARQVDGVGRALAIDLLLPGTGEAPTAIRDPNEPQPPPAASIVDEPRCTTVAITSDDGSAPDAALMQAVWDTLDAAREVNFLNYVIPPTYTAVDVKATVMAFPGYLPEDVQASAESSLRSWLDPALWGGTPSTTSTSAEDWALDTSARIYEAVDYLNRADGVHYVVTVQLREHGASVWGNVDVPLDGLAPLPNVGDLEITVQTP